MKKNSMRTLMLLIILTISISFIGCGDNISLEQENNKTLTIEEYNKIEKFIFSELMCMSNKLINVSTEDMTQRQIDIDNAKKYILENSYKIDDIISCTKEHPNINKILIKCKNIINEDINALSGESLISSELFHYTIYYDKKGYLYCDLLDALKLDGANDVIINNYIRSWNENNKMS